MTAVGTIDKLVRDFLRMATDVYSPPAPGTALVINFVIKHILDIGARQDKTLKQIERLLGKIRVQEFQSGLALLRDAELSPHDPTSVKLINQALIYFIGMTQVEEYPPIPILACFYAGRCYELLSDKRAYCKFNEAHMEAKERTIARLTQQRRYRKGLRLSSIEDYVSWSTIFSLEDSPVFQLSKQIAASRKQIPADFRPGRMGYQFYTWTPQLRNIDSAPPKFQSSRDQLLLPSFRSIDPETLHKPKFQSSRGQLLPLGSDWTTPKRPQQLVQQEKKQAEQQKLEEMKKQAEQQKLEEIWQRVQHLESARDKWLQKLVDCRRDLKRQDDKDIFDVAIASMWGLAKTR